MSHEHDLESVLLRALGKITPALNQIRNPKHIRMEFDHWKIELIVTPVSAERPAECPDPDASDDVENDTDESKDTVQAKVLAALGNSTLKGEVIARRVDYSYGGHLRGILSQMRKDGILTLSEDGYRRTIS